MAFCSSKQSDSDTNIVRRLKSSLATALNTNWKLPKYIVVILEADIIEYMDYTNFGISSIYGDILEAIIKEFMELITTRIEQLPTRARRPFYPFLYWAALPMHKNLDNHTRSKFNLTLDSILKLYPNMRMAHIKDWNHTNENLAQHGKLTGLGTMHYWKAIDSSLSFNIAKHEMIMNKGFFKRNPVKKSKPNGNDTISTGDRQAAGDGRMAVFFNKYKKINTSGKGGRTLPELD